MNTGNNKLHWEKIYTRLNFNEVSWYQQTPTISLELTEKFATDTKSHIIDVGAGESKYTVNLLAKGYNNLSILDISQKALEKASNDLGSQAHLVKLIESDVCSFLKPETFDLWHDRAVFHFLTDESAKENYINNLYLSLKSNGKAIIGTFADDGPEKCSGLEVKRYSRELLIQTLGKRFEALDCIKHTHTTPSGSMQKFIFCVFQKC